MTYSVSIEGVQALRTLATMLRTSLSDIAVENAKLLECLDDTSNGLGPHASTILNLIKYVNDVTQHAQGPIEDLADIVSDIADGYEEIIGTDFYGDASDDDPGHGQPVKVLTKRR